MWLRAAHQFIIVGCIVTVNFVVAYPTTSGSESLENGRQLLFKRQNNKHYVFVKEEEDAEDTVPETTAKPKYGPGHEGILAGLAGIFSNVVDGNLNGVVESTFNFVPRPHQPNVQYVYNSLKGQKGESNPQPGIDATKAPPRATTQTVVEEEEVAGEEDLARQGKGFRLENIDNTNQPKNKEVDDELEWENEPVSPRIIQNNYKIKNRSKNAE